MTPPEFSRPLRVESLPPKGRTIDITATAAELAALAARFDLEWLAELSARLELRPLVGIRGLAVSGRLRAELTQSCVVTLDPVTTRFDHAFTVSFEPPDPDAPNEIVVDLDDEDPPEPLIDGIVELGEAVVQVLSTLIDPFPRAPGASLPESEEEQGANGPFAALKGWKRG